jgi:hypothetical protein
MNNNKRHRKKLKPSAPSMDPKLRDGLHRLSQRDAMFYGFALARLRAHHQQTVAEQAAALGISEDALAALAMCKVPRADHRDADLAVVADRVGVGVDALAAILRDAERLAATPVT